jgi:predicted kinase
MASVHMVCGFLGAGKTTFAKAVAQRNGAVRLSVDELYLRLFADGPTYELDERALQRLFEVLHDIWPAIVRAGTDVVLDFGFWRRELRDQVRAVARASGAATRLYWLQCPSETALARCLARNGTPGAFLISEHGFHELRARFESPGADESAELIDTS